jgi:predicted regulator of Ras-like GTPase activity (Roadblock/LC7/MglB family)
MAHGRKFTPFIIKPAPKPAPEPTPILTPDPAPVSTSASTLIPAPAPTPVATPVITAVPAPVPTPVATPDPAPVPAPIPTPVIAPIPTPVIAPVPIPVPTPVDAIKEAMIGKLDQVIERFHIELGSDLISTEVVGLDGIAIAGGSTDPNYNSTDAAARLSTVLKLADKASSKLGMGKVDDNLTTTDKSYIIARFIGDGTYFWGVAVTRNATLGSVRMIMNEFASQVWDMIPR